MNYSNQPVGNTIPESQPLLTEAIQRLRECGSRVFNYTNDIEHKINSIKSKATLNEPEKKGTGIPPDTDYAGSIFGELKFLNSQCDRLEKLSQHLSEII